MAGRETGKDNDRKARRCRIRGGDKDGELNEESGVRKHGVRYSHWCGGMLEACMVCCSLTRFNLSVDCKL